mmetsp:Transcript_30844/g.80478  ORF Transcript_30844/g.80478 Transcript_30844/m.80478 type:complete len:128 (-) Transcript_30844:481-864(-)
MANMTDIVTQHGPQEYAVNRLQTCAKDLTTERGEAWHTRYWAFVFCSEDEYDQTPATILSSCAAAASFNSSETASLSLCYSTEAGDASVIREAKATVDHPGTPYILVNGKDSSAEDALKDVCKSYTG